MRGQLLHWNLLTDYSVQYAISQKRQGWVTNEDKLECIMESKGKGAPLVDWGPEDDYH